MRRRLNVLLVNLAATALVLGAAVPALTTSRQKTAASPTSATTRAHPVRPTVRELAVPTVSRRAARVPVTVAATGRRSTRHFGMVGVTWAPGASYAAVDVELRVRSHGRWGDWQRLEGHDDGGGRPGTEPLWVGDADGVQARVTSAGDPARDVRVALVDPGTSAADPTVASPVRLSAASTGGVVPQPTVVSRAEWGADESLTTTCDNGTYTDTVKVAFVHHTAGTNDYTSADSPGIVRGIYAYHTQSRGYCDIGYNFLVDRFGTIFEGRRGGIDLPVFGAHTGGYNTDSFGVSLMGNFETGDPTPEMMSSLADVIAWKLSSNYRDPAGTTTLAGKQLAVISGHRDAGQTACPGQSVYDQLPALRQTVRDMIAPYDSAIYQKWQRLGGEAGFVGSPFRGEETVDGATSAEFAGADLWWKSGDGTHAVQGAIRRQYRRFAAHSGRLGVPTSDQRTGRLAVTRFNVFEGGRIYWSARTGARPLYGPILTRYLRLGADGSRLRLPKSGIRTGARRGSTFTVFQGGRVYRSARTGTHQVWGPILRRYVRLGAESSRLRLPRTNGFRVAGGTAQKFQGGRIRWDRSTGRITVTYW